MSNVTVNISFQDTLLANIDLIAKKEARSRSEFIREAARLYIEKKERWDWIFDRCSMHVKGLNLSDKDVLNEIQQYRKGKIE